jgi:hypothetical protein
VVPLSLIYIVLLLTQHYDMKAYWGMKVQVYAFLISALDEVVSFTLPPLYPKRAQVYIG